MKARFSTPAAAGKFNRPDPVRYWDWLNPQSLNLYQYVMNNPVSLWDPLGLRPLTPGEIRIAKAIFGDKINYKKVDIENHRKRVLTGKVPKKGALTQKNKIFYHPDGGVYLDDFSKSNNPGVIAVFLHEMTHIWQWQKKKFALAFRNTSYEYEIKDGDDFVKDFGREQQASIVEHFFLSQKHANGLDYKNLIPYDFLDYYEILKMYLPVEANVEEEIIVLELEEQEEDDDE